MNPANSVRVAYDDLRSLGFAGIGANYAAVGAAFANPVRLIKITNLTDVTLKVSFDGIHDQDIAPFLSSNIYDYGSNMGAKAGLMELPVGNRVYVKREAAVNPASGNVYVTVIYAAQK